MENQPIDPRLLRPGTIIKAPIQGLLGLFWHFGVVSDRCDYRGVPLMISNSWTNRGAAEEVWEVFSAGQNCQVVGFPSELSSYQVVTNARLLSSRPYSLLLWDCERFANACHGLPARSKQMEAVLATALAGALFMVAQN